MALSRIAARIAGTGSHVPERRLTNFELEKMVETSDAWIKDRTGISARRIAAPEVGTTDLAGAAARRALESAEMSAGEIDGIIVATVTSERIMPSAACVLQSSLGCRPILAFDVSAACSGFLYALSVADSFIQTGRMRTCLVVGAECLSRIVDYRDRETCVLFGDGAGAVVLERAAEGEPGRFLSFHLSANGGQADQLTLKSVAGGGGPFADPLVTSVGKPFVEMRGREIFKSAVTAMRDRCREALVENGLTVEQIDWFIPHQANRRIIDAVGSQLGFAPERVIVNLETLGNTSSASIPIAFDEAARSGRIRRGQKVMMAAFGGGLTSASAMLEY